jgi:hypothetical protein
VTTDQTSPSPARPIDPASTPTFPLLLRAPTLLLALAVFLSAIPGIVIAIDQRPHFLVGFEISVLIASFFACLIALGKFAQAPAMGLFIVGGATIVGAALGEDQVVFILLGQQPNPTTSGVDLIPYAFARLAAGAIFFALGTVVVLIQRPGKSLKRLMIGSALALPLLAMGGALAVPTVRASFFGLNGIVFAGLSIIVMIVTLGFLAASGHWLIRAFETGLPECQDRPGA